MRERKRERDREREREGGRRHSFHRKDSSSLPFKTNRAWDENPRLGEAPFCRVTAKPCAMMQSATKRFKPPTLLPPPAGTCAELETDPRLKTGLRHSATAERCASCMERIHMSV